MMQLHGATALPVVPIRSVEAARDHYLAATAAGLDRVVAAAPLPEPVVRDPDLAARTLEMLIETLTGLAAGMMIGAVTTGVRRTFRGGISTRVDAAVTRAITSLSPPSVAPGFAIGAPQCRAFGGELRERLRLRILAVARDGQAILAAITSAVLDTSPEELPALARLLGVLAGDPLPAERYAPRLAQGWQCFAAITQGMPCDRSDPLWARWAAGIAGERAVEVPTQAQLAAAGFIARIG